MFVTSSRPSCARSRSGEDLGPARLPWSNIGAGDALALDDGRVIYFVDVVTTAATRRPTRS